MEKKTEHVQKKETDKTKHTMLNVADMARYAIRECE